MTDQEWQERWKAISEDCEAERELAKANADLAKAERELAKINQ